MSGYLLNWIPCCDIHLLRPVLDLGQAISLANQGDPDQLANMVRLNWMVQDLKINPMIKPIFCRDNFDVIVGDTRIMAAKLVGLDHVPVMCYSQLEIGQLCSSIDDIKHYAGFGPGAVISYVPDVDILCTPPEWIDIGDARTKHHGHDQSQRLQAINQHLRLHPAVIDKAWILEPKVWGDIFF